MNDIERRRYELGEAVTEHDRLARQAGRRWYDEASVRLAYARVCCARWALHPLTLAADYGAANELEFYGGER